MVFGIQVNLNWHGSAATNKWRIHTVNCDFWNRFMYSSPTIRWFAACFFSICKRSTGHQDSITVFTIRFDINTHFHLNCLSLLAIYGWIGTSRNISEICHVYAIFTEHSSTLGNINISEKKKYVRWRNLHEMDIVSICFNAKAAKRKRK